MVTHSFETLLHNYVQLAVRVGVNLQQGQTLVIQAPVQAAKVVRLAAKEAYEAGARYVHVEWNDDELTRIRYAMAPEESFGDAPQLRMRSYEKLMEQDPAFLSFVTANPDLLEGVDPERVAKATKAARQAMQRFYDGSRKNQFSWSLLAVASEVWADKVFPDQAQEERERLLWNAIFQATRADLADPIGAWQQHIRKLQETSSYLNEKRYRALHYRAPGTDLTVELADDHQWVAAGSRNQKGTSFVANMPTEEVFTAPKRGGVNGVVRSTKPLNYNGNLIEDFSLTFQDGRVVDIQAGKGTETLKRLISSDEGAAYLGEAALVPHRSPISEMGIIFYNTLFDENASSHLALGGGYAFTIQGGTTMTKEELAARGLNESLVHVDFMIGSAEMDIDGIAADGSKEPIIRNGDWVI